MFFFLFEYNHSFSVSKSFEITVQLKSPNLCNKLYLQMDQVAEVKAKPMSALTVLWLCGLQFST